MFFRSIRWPELSIVVSGLSLLILTGCGTTPLSTSSASKPSPASHSGKPSSYPVLPPAGSGRGGYYLDDGPGDDIPEGLLDVADAIPKVEPYSRRGNSPYVVFGKRYEPFTDDRPYKVRGHGSWYGKKFHGQKTSSGELYDMYKMTAAHPTLPIPSYARVTNVSNGKQVIVRVNDRGPFRSGRVIDLSYTAALRLGYIGHGSTELEVERLLPEDIERIVANRNASASTMQSDSSGDALMPVVQTATLAPAPVVQQTVQAPPSGSPPTSQLAAPQLAAGYYLQFGAYAQSVNAETARARIAQTTGNILYSLRVESVNNLYRVYSGPFSTRDDAASVAVRVEQSSGIKPFIVQH
ncbi:MAG: septal ring lytic transglycosylase RlpA family protein [Oxalicibacterium faecigallinarum]|uniref:septal ring lytic transglycosylase RlpA family protein n=1 Tax=Oxalicibacterium faecigallinarum TaxID=573741 RepID=UPI0028075918|nr:septal ring lytic transglycosylase RlpA family protein [Oxalicibacterium faecigallinarum]MDQ7969673.1 septal ring lytic transglycosylase RlpA family protein [Oxalicibacterium faecigallinarum]